MSKLLKGHEEIMMLTQEIRTPRTLELLSKHNLKAMTLDKGNILNHNQEIRSVNGIDVLYFKYVHIDETTGSAKWVCPNYYLSTQKGTVRVWCNTIDYLFAEHKSEIMGLLNGLVDQYSEMKPQKNDETIESKLLKLKDLMDRGLITQEDYDEKKHTLLNSY